MNIRSTTDGQAPDVVTRYKCSNPACGVFHDVDPCGPCPTCHTADVHWSTYPVSAPRPGAPKPINPATGQHGAYYILSEEERAKGFVRPVRTSYVHVKCGTVTCMSREIAETYARDPKFYGSTFCCGCRVHAAIDQFRWQDSDEVVGS